VTGGVCDGRVWCGRSTMTEEEVVEAGGRYMSCQRRSEVTLTCTCGHDATKHQREEQ
jgi:hypothetical protein